MTGPGSSVEVVAQSCRVLRAPGPSSLALMQMGKPVLQPLGKLASGTCSVCRFRGPSDAPLSVPLPGDSRVWGLYPVVAGCAQSPDREQPEWGLHPCLLSRQLSVSSVPGPDEGGEGGVLRAASVVSPATPGGLMDWIFSVPYGESPFVGLCAGPCCICRQGP